MHQTPQIQTPAKPHLPFLEALNFPYLLKLMDDPVRHDATWKQIPIKLPSYIPNFEEKNNEYPGDQVTTFHLWCSSNLLNGDYIRL